MARRIPTQPVYETMIRLDETTGKFRPKLCSMTRSMSADNRPFGKTFGWLYLSSVNPELTREPIPEPFPPSAPFVCPSILHLVEVIYNNSISNVLCDITNRMFGIEHMLSLLHSVINIEVTC